MFGCWRPPTVRLVLADAGQRAERANEQTGRRSPIHSSGAIPSDMASAISGESDQVDVAFVRAPRVTVMLNRYIDIPFEWPL